MSDRLGRKRTLASPKRARPAERPLSASSGHSPSRPSYVSELLNRPLAVRAERSNMPSLSGEWIFIEERSVAQRNKIAPRCRPKCRIRRGKSVELLYRRTYPCPTHAIPPPVVENAGGDVSKASNRSEQTPSLRSGELSKEVQIVQGLNGCVEIFEGKETLKISVEIPDRVRPEIDQVQLLPFAVHRRFLGCPLRVESGHLHRQSGLGWPDPLWAKEVISPQSSKYGSPVRK